MLLREISAVKFDFEFMEINVVEIYFLLLSFSLQSLSSAFLTNSDSTQKALHRTASSLALARVCVRLKLSALTKDRIHSLHAPKVRPSNLTD